MISLKNKFIGTTILAGLMTFSPAISQTTTLSNPALNDRVSLSSVNGPIAGNVEIANGKSRVIQFDRKIGHSLIADPKVADIIPMTDMSLYVLGKEKGTTSLTLFDDNKTLLGVFDINVSHDMGGLKHRIYELAPNENIEVRTNGDSIVLSGQASSPAVAAMAQKLAEQHAPGKVLNVIQTSQSQQVMLSVRIAEVERSVSKELGLQYSTFFEDVEGLGVLNGLLDPGKFANGVLEHNFGLNSNINTNIILDALEENGVLTTLAEPSLVAISGETAHFLAGGEFPVPVASDAQGNGITITIEFKEFGVKLAYTPTVIGDTINLVIEPEVSVLDPNNGIELNNIVIPGLVVRRAHTTVDLKNGQSFAIAGLLQESFEDTVSQIPGIGSIPILGALARSSKYRKKETELLIIVTPHIVEPIEGGDIPLPTDNFIRPSDAEIFFEGKTESQGYGYGTSGYIVE